MEMVKTKVIMLLLCVTALTGYAQEYEWSSVKMDGSRVGCNPTSDDSFKAFGRFLEDGTYLAPNGKEYGSGSSVAAVASFVQAAQPKMARVKTVVAYSEEEMRLKPYECPLSNWCVNILMDKVSSLSGKKVDVGISNFGGIRMNMPAGNVILDDMLSMFPFKNDVVYLAHKGSELRKIFEKMAATRFQIVGGAEILAENGKLSKVMIGGEPLDDDKVYNVATISFLLYGGDNLALAENAVDLVQYDVQIVEAVLDHLEALKAEGKNITPPAVTYVTVK